MSAQTHANADPAHINSEDESLETSRMSFGDHLDELRTCCVRALLGLAVATGIMLFFGRRVLTIICLPLWIVQHANGLPPSLTVLAPMAGFVAYLKIAILSGLIVAMPWMLYQAWRFVASGLYSHERRFVRLLVPSSMILFFLGVAFLYFIVLPIVLHFFIRFHQRFDVPELTPSAFERLVLPGQVPPAPSTDAGQLPNLPILETDPVDPRPGDAWINAVTRRLIVKTPAGVLSTPLDMGPSANAMQSQFAIDFYVSFVLMLCLGFGLTFQTPIVVFFLAWTGILSIADMAGARRYVLLGMLILAAILTPPDVISQLLLTIPMYLLFELGLVLARLSERRTTNAETAP